MAKVTMLNMAGAEAGTIDLKDSILSKRDSKIFDFLDYDAVQQYVKQGDYKTWILLTLALWFESNL